MVRNNASERPLETDEDTLEQDLYDGSLYPYSIDKKDIEVKEDKFSVYELLRKLRQGKLIIDPEFQRNRVWSPTQQSRFIESILLNLPLPPIYLNQDKTGNYIIIDGLQRLSSLNDFMPEKGQGFKLKELRAMPKLNDKGFKDLGDLQTDIEDKNFMIYIIKPTVPIKIVYDIFNRINTGGTQLNRQEIRNCIYLGKATRLLKKLAKSEIFRKAIDNGISPKRMKDREAVLRYLAFTIFDFEKDYKNDMDDFLGNALKEINRMNDDQINELKKDFERVMSLSYDFFGRYNFRFPSDTGRGTINIAILESVSYFFSNADDKFLIKNKRKIISNFQNLLKDNDYIDAVRHSTGDTKRVINRFRKAQEILGAI